MKVLVFGATARVGHEFVKMALENAKSAVEKSHSYCVPVIPFAYSEYFRGFPGQYCMPVHIVNNMT